jgi:hypothetical protein
MSEVPAVEERGIVDCLLTPRKAKLLQRVTIRPRPRPAGSWRSSVLGAQRKSLRRGPHHWHRGLLRPRRDRPRRRDTEKCEEVASSWVEHGLPLETRRASLPQAQVAPEAPAGPWGSPESF